MIYIDASDLIGQVLEVQRLEYNQSLNNKQFIIYIALNRCTHPIFCKDEESLNKGYESLRKNMIDKKGYIFTSIKEVVDYLNIGQPNSDLKFSINSFS